MSAQFDEEEVRKAYTLMRGKDNLVEVRIIGGRKPMSGYFNDCEEMIKQLKKIDLSDKQVYWTINALKDACSGRIQFNYLTDGNGKKLVTTSDTDVLGYKFLMVDIDPVRPADISSNEEELNCAKEIGNEVDVFMTKLGFEKPLFAYSGNGVHLMYGISLANTPENKKLCEKCLKTLDMLFSNDKANIDTTTFNQSRISKLYGCVSRKGRNAIDRPHRLSRIIGNPKEIKISDKVYLEKLVSYYPEEMDKPSKYNNYNPRQFDLDEWLNKYYINYKTTSFSDGTKYVLDCCPFDSSHKGRDAVIIKSRNGAIGFHCFHNSCSDKTWKDVRLLFEPDAYEKKWQEQEQKMYKSFNRNKVKESKPIVEKESNPIFLTAKNIFDIPKVEESFVKTGITDIDKRIRGLKKGFVSVWSGLRGSAKSTVLSQITLNAVNEGNNVGFYSGELAPKNFMRWMNLQACGKSKVEQGKYEGYYNVPRKIQEQIANWMEDHFWLYNNDYGNDSKAILEQLEKTIQEKQLDLLILDNLMAFDLSTLNENKWDGQKDFVWELHKMAQKYDVHIAFVAHPRKAMGFLRLDDISGSSDIANAVEYAFIVHRNNYDFKRLTCQMFGWKDDNEIYDGTNIIEICKDRDGGTQDYFVPLFYEVETKRLKNYKSENVIYGWDKEDDGFITAEDITMFE